MSEDQEREAAKAYLKTHFVEHSDGFRIGFIEGWLARAQQAGHPPTEEPDSDAVRFVTDDPVGLPEEPAGEPWALLLDLLRASGDIVFDKASGSKVLAKGPTWLEAAKSAHKAIMKRDAVLAAKEKSDGV